MNKPVVNHHADYYDNLWSKYPSKINSDQLIRLSKIFEYMSGFIYEFKGKPMRICDLGCGTGWLSNELSKYGSVVGVDYSQTGINIARERYPGVVFECQNVLDYESNHKYDLIVSSEVIEHIENQDRYLNIIHQLLNDNGRLILTCPNRIVRGYFPETFEGMQPIEKWLSMNDMRVLLNKKFQIEKQETFLFNYSSSLWMRIAHSAHWYHRLKMLKMFYFYKAFLETKELGLYQITLAKKIGS